MKFDKELKTITAKEYCKIKDLKYTIVVPEKNENIFYPEFEYDIGYKKTLEVIHPEIYIAELNNVNIIGNDNIIFDDMYCIYDIAFLNGGDKYHFNIPTTFVDSQKATIQVEFEDDIIDEGIMLSQFAVMNFTHLMIELIPRLFLLEKSNIDKDIPLIIDENIKAVRGFDEIVDYFNKQKRKIKFIKPYKAYTVKKLIMISNVTILPIHFNPQVGMKYIDTYLSSLVMKEISKELVIENKLTDKIYLSRKGGRHRIVNEDDVENLYREFGYNIVNPSLLYLEDRKKLFSTAKYIALVYGSGIANALFFNTNSTVLFIQPKTMESSVCYDLIAISGAELIAIDAKSEHQYDHACSFTVDIEYLRRVLTKIHSQDN